VCMRWCIVVGSAGNDDKLRKQRVKQHSPLV
jgi:hypothetical protein